MKNLLLNYMNARFRIKPSELPCKEDGPVITISREAGCPGEEIAKGLQARLNEIDICNGKGIWHIISKEILQESAHELDLHPDKIKYIFDSEQRSTMDEIIGALASRYYKNERMIRKTITEVITSFAKRGFVIILGRGGVALLENKRAAMHIKLMAPEEWRVKQVMETRSLNEEKALKYTKDEDTKRLRMINSFKNDKRKNVAYDIIFDCSRMSGTAIVNAIAAIISSGNTIHQT